MASRQQVGVELRPERRRQVEKGTGVVVEQFVAAGQQHSKRSPDAVRRHLRDEQRVAAGLGDDRLGVDACSRR